VRLLSSNGLFIVGLCALSVAQACAQDNVVSSPQQPRIFLPGELTPSRYVVIRHLWVEPWRSAVSVPTHKDSGAAIADVLAETRKLGADGVINLICLNDRGTSAYGESAFFCYGDAVKLKQSGAPLPHWHP